MPPSRHVYIWISVSSTGMDETSGEPVIQLGTFGIEAKGLHLATRISSRSRISFSKRPNWPYLDRPAQYVQYWYLASLEESGEWSQ